MKLKKTVEWRYAEAASTLTQPLCSVRFAAVSWKQRPDYRDFTVPYRTLAKKQSGNQINNP